MIVHPILKHLEELFPKLKISSNGDLGTLSLPHVGKGQDRFTCNFQTSDFERSDVHISMEVKTRCSLAGARTSQYLKELDRSLVDIDIVLYETHRATLGVEFCNR